MFNCHKLFLNGRLFGIFHTSDRADFVLNLLDDCGLVYESQIVPSFIEDIGF